MAGSGAMIVMSEAIAHSLSMKLHSNLGCQRPASEIVPESKHLGLRTKFHYESVVLAHGGAAAHAQSFDHAGGGRHGAGVGGGPQIHWPAVLAALLGSMCIQLG